MSDRELLAIVGHNVPDPEGRPMKGTVEKYEAGIKEVPYVYPDGRVDEVMTTSRFFCNGVVFEESTDLVDDMLQTRKRLEVAIDELERMAAHYAQQLWFKQRRDALEAEGTDE